MPESQADAAFGTLLKAGDGGAPEVYSTLGEIVSVGGPEIERETIDVTHMESPDKFREFIGSLKDGGEVEVGVNLLVDPAGAFMTKIEALIDDDDRSNFLIAFPDDNATNWQFSGLLTNFAKDDAEVDGKLGASYTLKVSGKPDFDFTP
jgi:hypothetical protein